MQVMQDPREPSAGRNQASARYAGLEAQGVAEMPIVQERPLRAAGSHDQAHATVRELTPYVWVHPDEER
jgi:hypothetical protein